MIRDYLELDRMPHMWCKGCGNGIVLHTLLRAAEECGMNLDNTVFVSGIGCSSRLVGYTKFSSMHTAHGRALPVATGIKMARPDLNVVVISGDGDATAIGGNHFIHSCRRNIDITLIIINNQIYGMTKGQFSPLTPENAYTKTTTYGNMDIPFDIPRIAIASGASYVARASVYHTELLRTCIINGCKNKGFSVIECYSMCPTHFGRSNGSRDAVAMMEQMRDELVFSSSGIGADPAKIIGELYHVPGREYTEKYQDIIRAAR